MYCHFFLFKHCLWHPFLVSPSFRGVHSPNTSTGPSLRPEHFPHRVPVSPDLTPSSSCGWWGLKFCDCRCFYIYGSYSLPSLLSFQKGWSGQHFLQSNGNPICFEGLQLYSLPEEPAKFCPASQTWLLSPAPSSNVRHEPHREHSNFHCRSPTGAAAWQQVA